LIDSGTAADTNAEVTIVQCLHSLANNCGTCITCETCMCSVYIMYYCMALYSLYCADVLLGNCSLTHLSVTCV